jgi:hypothetical protein
MSVPRRLGEGSWIADDYMPDERMITQRPFFVWVSTGNDGDGNPTGMVFRYLDRSYQLRIR